MIPLRKKESESENRRSSSLSIKLELIKFRMVSLMEFSDKQRLLMTDENGMKNLRRKNPGDRHLVGLAQVLLRPADLCHQKSHQDTVPVCGIFQTGIG